MSGGQRGWPGQVGLPVSMAGLLGQAQTQAMQRGGGGFTPMRLHHRPLDQMSSNAPSMVLGGPQASHRSSHLPGNWY